MTTVPITTLFSIISPIIHAGEPIRLTAMDMRKRNGNLSLKGLGHVRGKNFLQNHDFAAFEGHITQILRYISQMKL